MRQKYSPQRPYYPTAHTGAYYQHEPRSDEDFRTCSHQQAGTFSLACALCQDYLDWRGSLAGAQQRGRKAG